MINVKVDKRALDEFTRQLSVSGTKLERIVEEAAPAVGEVVSRMVMGEMLERSRSGDKSDRNFWSFMAARTDITVAWSGGTVIVTISGLTEGEVPDAENSRTGGNANANANLWARHEFGAVFDPESGKLTYTKDTGGVSVVRSSRAGGQVSKRTGSVDKLVRSLRAQIESSAVVLAAITASTATGEFVESATKGKVSIDKSAKAALKRANVSKGLLATMGVDSVKVTQKGQILLLGRSENGSVRFKGAKEFGIPTTIRR